MGILFSIKATSVHPFFFDQVRSDWSGVQSLFMLRFQEDHKQFKFEHEGSIIIWKNKTKIGWNTHTRVLFEYSISSFSFSVEGVFLIW